MASPYVKSRFPRVPDDYYPTIDPRCVYGFLEHFPVPGLCVDPCSPMGSGIVTTLLECGREALCAAEYTAEYQADMIVSNPPYIKGLVDSVIWNGIARVRAGTIRGAAYLLRSNFSFAKGRKSMFRDNPHYFGEIKLLFRPWWSDDHTASPIHNFVWHVWSARPKVNPNPIIMFSEGNKPS